MKNVTRGDFSTRAEIHGMDEIGDLATSFNTMSEKLETAQDKLLQSEKLASVGKLAAGMSHEINNPLVSILGYSELALEKMEDRGKMERFLRNINRDALRCKQIIDQLLTFAREEQKEEKEDKKLDQVVSESILLMDHALKKKKIEVRLTREENNREVSIAFSEITRVFINLVSNAIDAMEENGILQVRIFYEGLEYDEPGWMCVSMKDNGCGMKPENISRIFDPFFTTKDVGEGTGLGLSLSYGIVQNHGGTIEVESEEGGGTTFTVKLPAIKG